MIAAERSRSQENEFETYINRCQSEAFSFRISSTCSSNLSSLAGIKEYIQMNDKRVKKTVNTPFKTQDLHLLPVDGSCVIS
jgi:hypothetical protein